MTDLPNDHNAECFEGMVEDDRSKLCEHCKAERVVEEYVKGYDSRDSKLMESVWALATVDDTVRRELDLTSMGLLEVEDSLSHAPDEAWDSLEARHQFIKSEVRS